MSVLSRLHRVAAPTADGVVDSVTETARRRAGAMKFEDLVSWVEIAIMGVGRSYSDFLRGNDSSPLDGLVEARQGAAVLHVVLVELEQRRARGAL